MRTFEELCAIEPRLRELAERCAALPDGQCPVSAWGETGGFKEELCRLVGFYCGNPDLRNGADYDVAHRGTHGRLPYCERRCPRCGGEVAPADTFSGVGVAQSVEDIAAATAECYPTLAMRPSWALLVDFLGFSRQVATAAREGRSDAHLAQLDRTVREAYGYLRPDEHRWALKFFSDNVLLGCPVYDDGESEAGRMLEAISEFQLSLVFHGQFARGGLAVGELYVSPTYASGAALIDAHLAEDKKGTPPRIILSPAAKLVFAGHARYFGDEGERFVTIPLLEDVDGEWFVDYLAPICGVRPYAGFDPTAIRRHRAAIEEALASNRDDAAISTKYEWLAGYHNYAVRQRVDDRELLVAGEFPSPRGLVGKESHEAEVAVLSPDGSLVPPEELLRRAILAVG